ncbi:MAG: nitrite reductase small subunit NirD [Pseudophaeobacter sp. bin_em_oilr2.035]|uniref:Nitrite reductase small subunit NirD n=1 Tax=Phaeobacter gallaeciensis TaxID=60890 RepID=A0ABD4X6P4_9RHOB|nr:nitrite reductase small subunit NirD [Phaeobacter gallaeciensis]MDF1772331.1 nitrite reductase small subunit NirD [Pseudophaeobacter sp. bin_em_oilr2.035]MDE4060047.1 nitrite reductase small subunit NirD [Phaeobacter gallaeciensis]MDE4122891.1 nitrite reductase small subunit NirD [Phaeobacter gallaeciensis]MDE4127535.1 nitrite reductase small subunit NirD [Phaeobacter gallaeciensis]MDE4144412.1 nitrite reductase small subunit NirD [Phaeobacter gallaeciensis]
MSWIDIGHIDEVPLRGARLLKTPMGCIAVFRTGEAEVFAASNSCPHKGGPLSEGIVHGQSVTCPLHNWVFDLNTGEAQGADDGRIETYPLRLEGARILIDASALARRSAA